MHRLALFALGALLRFVPSQLPFTLENAETEAKHQPEILPGGVAVFDFDRDGFPDIYFTNGAAIPGLQKTGDRFSNRLFRNDQRGGFIDVTAKSGLAGTGYDIGVAAGDFDNDGLPDLFVTGVHRNTLYRNQGNGVFADITNAAGLEVAADPKFGKPWAVAAAWVDIDNDGHLDLFVSNYCLWDPATEKPCLIDGRADYCHPRNYPGQPNALYRNNGNGTFQDISAASGIRQHIGRGMGVAIADYDSDGRQDIFVANDKSLNFLFHNLGGGKFEEVALEAGVAAPGDGKAVSGMGAEFRDLNNDGRPDIFLTALRDETFPLYWNRGANGFDEGTLSSRLAVLSLKMAGWATGAYDFDNDGHKDLFVARSDALSPTGSRGPAAKETNGLFHNTGNGTFTDATTASGLTARPPAMYRGAAFADFDRDGRVDVVVTALGAKAELWRNTTAQPGHWLAIQLTGTKSNRDAIGANIKVVTATGAQYNHMTTSVGYASSSAGSLHFGLGANKTAELIEIRWPSGKVQQLRQIPADQILAVREP